MSSANPLDLPLITDAQNSKHITHNDAILKLSQALGNRTDVDVSAGSEVVLPDTAQRNYFINIFGAAVAGREVELPAVNRTLLASASAANAEDVTLTIDGGLDAVVLPPGARALVVSTDEPSLVGFFLAQTAVVSNFIDLTDTPSNFSDQSGKLLAVKGDETGVEFVDPPTGGGGGAEELDELSDVTINEIEDGQTLIYSEILGAFINSDLPFPDVNVIQDLQDVDIDEPLENQVVAYDAATETWQNKTITGAFTGVIPSIKTIDYELTVDDGQSLILLEDCDVEIPAYEDVPIPVGMQVSVTQWGATASEVVPADGVTVHAPDTLVFAKRYASGVLTKVEEDVWLFTAYSTEAG